MEGLRGSRAAWLEVGGFGGSRAIGVKGLGCGGIAPAFLLGGPLVAPRLFQGGTSGVDGEESSFGAGAGGGGFPYIGSLVVLGQGSGSGSRRRLVWSPRLGRLLVCPSERGSSAGSGTVGAQARRREARKIAGIGILKPARVLDWT